MVQMLGWFRAEADLASRRKRSRAGQRLRKELESNKAAKFDVLSLVDHTHSAPAELFENAVVRNGLANQALGLWHCGRC